MSFYACKLDDEDGKILTKITSSYKPYLVKSMGNIGLKNANKIKR